MADTANLQVVLACLGQPVAGNPTQYMMERAFAHHGLDWRYLTFEVPPESLADAVRGMRAMGFHGGNITKPHKVAVLQYLDGTSEAAGLMGAVNCLYRQGERWLGENTDGKGFLQSLQGLVDPRGKRIVILGAGDLARAIAVELALAGAGPLRIVNRTASRGEELVALLRQRLSADAQCDAWTGDYAVPPQADILINATSLGLFNEDERVPVDVATLRPELIVADVIFNPPRTRFLDEAAQRGCTTLDGLGMLVNQAVISLRIWSGIEPAADVLRDALEEYLGI